MASFYVSKELHFSSAHALRGHTGGCENLHGHNWRVRITVAAQSLDHLGMVLDFGALKSAMQVVAHQLDHQFLNEVAPFDSINPTSENLARYFFDKVGQSVNGADWQVVLAEVWETETNRACYGEFPARP